MGKPKDENDAITMLRQLSGKTHQVFTAIHLSGRNQHCALNITDVTFKTLSDADIYAYWRSGEPFDKAGSYAIQGQGSLFIERINGSFSGVMGLPLFETAQLLAREGNFCTSASDTIDVSPGVVIASAPCAMPI